MNLSQTTRGRGLGHSSATHTRARKTSFADGLIFLSLGLLVFSMSASAFAGNTTNMRDEARESTPIPSYNDLACERRDHKSRGIAVRICRGFYDNPALVRDVDDMFIEYSRISAHEPLLLIWSQVTAIGERLHLRFYQREGGGWILLDSKAWERKTSPLDQDIPLFTLESQFGRAYQDLLCQLQEPNCNVRVFKHRFPRR